MQKKTIWLAALAAAAVMLAAGANMLGAGRTGAGRTGADRAGADRTADTQASAERGTVEEGCEILQTLRYTRCEHTVSRRMAAPTELYGKTMEEAAALYDEWQLTSFAPREIVMEQELPLFCPEHQVLLPDGAGYVCVFENRYGDAMALVRQLPIQLSALPAAAQEEIEMGKGFSSSEELDAWLESVES